MTDPSFIPASERELVAVYPDRHRADAARQALCDAGTPPERIHVDEDLAALESLEGEMHEELSRAWVIPNAGVVYPSGAARGLVLSSAVGIALGVAAAFPLALIDVGSSYWVRWIVFALVGASFGATVSLVAGSAAGAPRPGALPAAARGTVLRVEADTPEVQRVLTEQRPLRIDEFSQDGLPIATIYMERPDTLEETAKDIAANAGGDDYDEQR